MRVIFDQGTPAPLRNHLVEHQVVTAHEAGWSELGNGDLLQAAESEFDILVTTDQNLRYQQKITGRHLAILVLTTTSWPRVRLHVAAIAQVVSTLQPGEYREFTVPE